MTEPREYQSSAVTIHGTGFPFHDRVQPVVKKISVGVGSLTVFCGLSCKQIRNKKREYFLNNRLVRAFQGQKIKISFADDLRRLRLAHILLNPG
jgi:hypothetical protein